MLKTIWTENLEELVGRYYELVDDASVLPPEHKVTERVTARVAAVLKYVRLEVPERIENARQWQLRWRPDDAEERLRAALARLGWKVVTTKGRREQYSALTHSGAEEDRLVVIDLQTIARDAEQIQKLDPVVPIATRDVTVLRLADELYFCAVERMGYQPQEPWVDEIGRHFFVQQVLGLPFNPWVVELLNARSAG